MSYNGSGTFNINTTGQPVVAGTVITASAFNALTTDLATGLTTAITKDGQTTTTARITFAQGITSSLVTDSSSVSTGSIITAGGAGIAKNLYVGVNANVAGTLGVTGVATFSAAPIYSSLTASSAVATDASKGLVSVTNTGTGNNVLATSPTITTPTISSLSSASATALTLQSAGTTAVTIDTSQNVLVGTTTTTNNLRLGEKLALVTASNGSQGGMSISSYVGTGAGNAPIIDIQRSRGTTDGSMTAVASGDTLGYVLFRGADGTSFVDSANIQGVVDGTVATSQVPSRLVFNTANSSGSVAERARINAFGLGLGGAIPTSGTGITFPATQSASSDANTLDDYEEGTWTPNQGPGIVLVGTFSSSAKYTKIGSQVTLVGKVQGSTSVANVTNGGRLFTNAPFSASPNASGVLINDAQSQTGSGNAGGTDFYITPMSATPIIYFTITYFV